MYIVTVAPIGRGMFLEELHYFWKEALPLGSIVQITVRKKQSWGLVISCKRAQEEKALIKTYPYAIKKIDEVRTRNFFLPEYISAIQEINDYAGGHIGQTLNFFIPKRVLEEIGTSGNSITKAVEQKKHHATTWEGTHYAGIEDDERIGLYKSKIREMFAKHRSVFVVAPTIFEIERLAAIFKKGIEEYVVILHGELNKKTFTKAWRNALREQHPMLFIGTAPYLSLPRNDLGMLILERECSPLYKTQSRPFVDIKHALMIIARTLRLYYICGDVTLRAESFYEKEKGTAHPLSTITYRFNNSREETIAVETSKKENGSFNIIGKDLMSFIKNSLEKKERLFMFVNRKGLATFTVCNDCGKTLSCNDCTSPLVLYETKENSERGKTSSRRTYVCHKCGRERPSETRCDHCGGWRLAPLGIGVEGVRDAVLKQFPHGKIYTVEGTKNTGKKDVLITINDFMSSPGSILIGTEMALFYMTEPVENTAIAAIDSFFTIPDYSINERAINIIVRMKLLGQKRFLLQTRNDSIPLFRHIFEKNLMPFYREELLEREKFQYPPFTVFIKISRSGEQKIIKKELALLAENLARYEPAIYPAYTARVRGKYTINLLFKIPVGVWPDKKILAVLRALPPSFIINVNPQQIL